MPTSVRQDILLYKARGLSTRETHAAMQQDAAKGHGFGAAQGDQGVSLRSIQRVYERMDKHGIAVPKVQRKRAPTFSGPEGDAIRKWVERQTKGYFLDQLLEWFNVAFPHRVVGKSTMCRWIKYQGLTRKKGTVKPLQQSQHRIDQFWNLLQAKGVRVQDCAWMDEMGFLSGQAMRCVYGYSAQGKKFRASEKLGKGRRYDVLACMSQQGLVACDFYTGGTVQWKTFVDYCTESVFPAMNQQGKSVFIADNCAVRTCSMLRSMFAHAQCTRAQGKSVFIADNCAVRACSMLRSMFAHAQCTRWKLRCTVCEPTDPPHEWGRDCQNRSTVWDPRLLPGTVLAAGQSHRESLQRW